MVPLQEMAIRVLLNLGELEPRNYSVAVLVDALALRNECPHLWRELMPRLGECTNEELLRVCKEHMFTEPKGRIVLEGVLRGRLSTLSAEQFFAVFEHIAVRYTPDPCGEDLDDDESEADDDMEWSDKDEAVFASWRSESVARFQTMTNAELAVGLGDSNEDAVRVAIMDALLPRVKTWSPDELLLFWRDAAYDPTFRETVERECEFSFGKCSAAGLLRALDAPNAYWIWERVDEALFSYVPEFKRIAGISQ